jgi:hypothetical protein
MQTKSSYRVLKSTLLVGTAASLATACVVTTSGDGGTGGDFSFGGEGTSTSSKTSTGGDGSTSTAGKTATGGGGTGGSTPTAGASTVGGGGGAAYVAGVCDADSPTSTNEPSCNTPTDDGQDCKKCMKAQCCTEWKVCFGDTPTIACGWGETKDADGQFDCVQHCFHDNTAGETDPDKLLADCAGSCANQCDSADNGNVMQATSDLIDCANDPMKCQTDCFPFM